jgi:ribosomal protein S18 acetylase RimI-like enzyme
MEQSNDPNLSNLFSLYERVGSGYSESDLFSFEGFKVVKTTASVWPNFAFDIEPIAVDKGILASIVEHMKDLNMRPTAVVAAGPGLMGALKSQGFMPADQWTSMDYAKIGNRRAGVEKDGASVSLIKDRDAIKAWSEIVSQELFAGRSLDFEIFVNLQRAGADLLSIRKAGELVGSAMIYFDENGSPGIYMLCIRSSHQGQGFGRLILEACLARLQEKAIDTVYLQSTQKGLSLYRRSGFRESIKYWICCKIK